MKTKKWFLVQIVAVAFGVLPSNAGADDTVKPSADEHAQHHPKDGAQGVVAKEPSPEMRKQMADMHQMMADCLKSDKPMGECKQEMMKNCPMMKDGKACPMMGEMEDMMGGKMMHKKGKKAPKGN